MEGTSLYSDPGVGWLRRRTGRAAGVRCAESSAGTVPTPDAARGICLGWLPAPILYKLKLQQCNGVMTRLGARRVVACWLSRVPAVWSGDWSRPGSSAWSLAVRALEVAQHACRFLAERSERSHESKRYRRRDPASGGREQRAG